MKERLPARLLAAWTAFEVRTAPMSLADRAMLLGAVALAGPLLLLGLLMPWHDGSLKRARAQLTALEARAARLGAEEQAAQRSEREVAARAGELAAFDRLVVPSDAAIRLLNELTTRAEKAGLDVRFVKKNARFEKSVERTFQPPGDNGAPSTDPARAVKFKALPVEVSFTAPTADALAFLHILEGFRNLNVGVRSLALGAEGTRLSVALELEMIVEMKLPTGGQG